jgi:hypothetical protein
LSQARRCRGPAATAYGGSGQSASGGRFGIQVDPTRLDLGDAVT